MNLPKRQDVLIIGGGIVGLTLARELRRRGAREIVVLEKNPACGEESSSAAAGMLAPQAEADCADVFFEFCRESRDSYPQFAAELFAETGVDIELEQTGTLYLAFSDKDAEELEKRFAWQKAANLAVEKLSAQEVLEIEPNAAPEVVFGLRFPLDWQVENRKIIEALRRNAEFQQAEVKSLIYERNKVVGAETGRGKIYAGKTIIAAGAWTSLIKDRFDLLAGIRVAPVRGQMLAFAARPGKLFRHVIYTRRGYVVPRKSGRILFGATVENVGFDCRTTEAGVAALMNAAREISPVFSNLKSSESWAGLRPRAADRLPVIGEFPGIENLLVATAHYRNGILLAPKTSELLADKIADASFESKYLKDFSPQRFLAKEEEAAAKPF